jgi:hypothetical protein
MGRVPRTLKSLASDVIRGIPLRSHKYSTEKSQKKSVVYKVSDMESNVYKYGVEVFLSWPNRKPVPLASRYLSSELVTKDLKQTAWAQPPRISHDVRRPAHFSSWLTTLIFPQRE